MRTRRGTVELDGAVFTPRGRETFRQNVRVMLSAMASSGEAEARALLAPHHRSGDLEGSIHGRVQSLSGKKWALTAVVSSNLNRTKKRNSYAGYIETGFRRREKRTTVGRDGRQRTRSVGIRQGQFRGVQMFRTSARSLRTGAPDLTRGIG